MAKADKGGQWQWATSAGGASAASGLAIALDAAGSGTVTGLVQGQVTFGGTTVKGAGLSSPVVAKLDKDGQWQWATVTGSGSMLSLNSAYDITLDSAGNSFIAGLFSTKATFGTVTLTAQGVTDGFVARVGKDGKL